MQRYINFLASTTSTDSTLRVLSNATCVVYLSGTTTAATLYSDNGITPQSNPFFSSTTGQVAFYADNGVYDLIVSKIGFNTVTINGIELNDLIGPTGSNSVGYLAGGTGAVATTVQTKLRQTVSVKDYGAVGNGIADDTAAIQNAINYVKNRQNSSGRYGGAIYFPTGLYKVTDTIELAKTSDVDLRIAFFGDGGYPGKGATQIIFQPASAKDGLVLKSSQMCSFEDIEFISGNNNVDKLIYVTAQANPVFSAFMNAFRRCSFREFSGTTPITRLVTVAGGVLTEFEKCWFSGSNNVIRLGENLPSTASGGGAGQTIFKQCEIYHNIEILNSQGLNFDTCVFGRVNLTTPVSIYPAASGFLRNDFVTFNTCSQVLNISGSTTTFFTQGAASEGVIALNNRFTGYKTVFNFNGTGQVFLSGNWYQPPLVTTGCVAILIAANVENITINSEDFTLFQTAGFIAVDDNRLGVRKPLIVDSVLAAPYTFSNIGNYETIISTTAQIRGGLHRVRWALNISTDVDAATFIVRPTVGGGTITKASGLALIPANTTQLVFLECLVNIDGTTTAVTINLTCRQSAGAAATVQADSISFASFIQIEELQ